MDALYQYEITYRPKGDTRSPEACPSVMAAGNTPAERCTKAERDIASLLSQDYEIISCTMRDNCPACIGRGTTMKKPKGWRKKHNPPAWMMEGVRCAKCDGSGRMR